MKTLLSLDFLLILKKIDHFLKIYFYFYKINYTQKLNLNFK